MRRLTVYSRSQCHLCDELLRELEPLVSGRATIEIVDIDTDPALRDRYDILIPVVCADGRELFHYRLDRAAVLSWLAES
ncbi:MAG: glutaredoxin family protein [Gammaproteobacteria bacterium]|nr:glutaredoxin family protein [Gammaproteobacteria bacterium]